MIGIAIANSLGLNFLRGIFGPYKSRVEADGGITEAGQCVDAGATPLLQSASLLLIPSGYKSGKAYAEIPTNGNGDLTWTRTSTANRTNSSGNIELMATGVPRLSYMYGSCPAVLLEPQRTNLVNYSEDMTQTSAGNYSYSNVTISANQTIAIDGNATADKAIPTTTNATHQISLPSTPFTAGTSVTTLSVFAKQGELYNFRLGINASATNGATFNLSNGTISNITGGVTASIVPLVNGWYRCIVTGICGSLLQSRILDNIGSTSFAGNGTDGLFLWGWQYEQTSSTTNVNYATTYIPTSGASATRIADSFSRSNIYTNGLISASGGTWFVELRGNIFYLRDNTQGLFIGDSITPNTGDQLIIRFVGGGTRLAIHKYVLGVTTNLYTTTTDTTKIAIKWNGSTADIFANGTKVVAATAFTATVMENLIGANGVPIFIQAMGLWSTPQTDQFCQDITTL